MEVVLHESGEGRCLAVDPFWSSSQLLEYIAGEYCIPVDLFGLIFDGHELISSENEVISSALPMQGACLHIKHGLLGGIDFQHREGSKVGSGGVLSESQAAIERKERLRRLALETIDITKDPYFMRNHLGSFECRLCLTLHPNEGNYLAHTQGKRHQSNLGRRAAMEAKNSAPAPVVAKEVVKKRVIKIGRPGYKVRFTIRLYYIITSISLNYLQVTKSRDIHTRQRSLAFEIDYPQAEEGIQPRHRFMSAYEQKVEVPDKNYQYLLFACDPYETIAFKIPNTPVDKTEGRFFTNWDERGKKFVLQMFFVESA